MGTAARLRLRDQTSRRAPTHLFVSFTLVAALAAILYLYVAALERHEQRPVLIALPPQTQIHSLALDRVDGSAPLLLWRDGNGWREEGLEDGAPFRRIAADSTEAHEIFAEIPGLRGLVEEVVILYTPASFYGIGQFYADFHQIDDGEVLACLEGAHAALKRTPPLHQSDRSG